MLPGILQIVHIKLGWRNLVRKTSVKVGIGIGLVLVLVLVLCGVGLGLFSSSPSADDVAGVFLTDFASGDTAGAAKVTSDANAAKALMDKVRSDLKPSSVVLKADHTDTSGDKATASFTAKWQFGAGREWDYQGNFQLNNGDKGWQVQWAAADIHPKLAAGQSLAFYEQQPAPAPILDRDGSPLLAPTTVINIVLDRKQAGDLNSVAKNLANALNKFDASTTQQSIVDGANKTPDGQDYPVLSLRDSDYQQVKAQIHDLPGVSFPTQVQLLSVNKTLGPQILSAVKSAVTQDQAGNAGWRVATLDAAGNEVSELYTKPAQPDKPVTTTLSQSTQAAAQAAIANVPQQAMIVAIQPSTGELLAVAQNSQADTQGLIALNGQFPPGSTFKIITGAAVLETGKVTPDTPQLCPGTTTIEGRVIPNENKFDLGTVPLRAAFAQSCNTTFSQLAVGLPNDALTNTSKQLGLGADFTIPGITTLTGSVPTPTSTLERAEDGFGQGKDQASPFGMALIAATVVKGSIPTPSLLRGAQTKVNTPAQQPVPGPVLDSLRQMMRAVVTQGTATGLAGIPDVAGKTGTAQFGDGTHSHGWFAGYRGDLAFAVLLVDAGSSTPAVNVANAFLRGLH